MFLISSALRGPLPGGPFSERIPVLVQYAGSFLAAALMGGAIVLVLWGVRRLRSERYETPRRDLAIAILLMTVVTFRPVQAAERAGHDLLSGMSTVHVAPVHPACRNEREPSQCSIDGAFTAATLPRQIS